MAGTEALETTDVIICGCGPTGALLSVLLSQYSIPHVVIERDAEINADPRGIALDEDGIRCLQACGIYDKIFTEIGQSVGVFYFISQEHHDLTRKAFMQLKYSTTEGGTGHPGFMCHKQPAIEKNLRSRIQELGVAKMRLGSRVVRIQEDEDWVQATYVDNSNTERVVRGRFLVGADGKTGFTRKQYLEPKGIKLQNSLDASYEKTWVALNWKISLPTPKTHPDFPLWKKGYTPLRVYNEFFPADFRFLCNPARAAVCGRFGLEEDRLWRFEFVTLPGEDPAEMATPAMIAKVVHPYITHPGSRHGIDTGEDIIFPLDCIEVLRCRPFFFSARSCNKWAVDRVILCGDAAHVFPPFGGQGIASAFRDALSVAWRLYIVTQSSLAASHTGEYHKLLQGWYSERKQQLDTSLKVTVDNGAYVTESNRLKVFFRDWSLWLMQLVPSWKHWVELGGRRDGMIQYQWHDDMGMAFLPTGAGGRNFPQVYVSRVSDTVKPGKILFTDDVLFARHKKGLFQLAVLVPSTSDVKEAYQALTGIGKVSGGALHEDEATVFLDLTDPSTTYDVKSRSIYRLATSREFANDPAMCTGRPEPVGYDPHRMSKDVGYKRFIILRPDRFVFAACDTREELMSAAGEAGRLVFKGSL